VFECGIRGGRLQTNPLSRVGAALLTLIVVAVPRPADASDIITRGFDLSDPLPGTAVNLPGLGLVPFVGVPLGTFDFGVGPVPTFNADTIIERLDDANAPVDLVPVLLLAMQLRSEIAIDMGFGLDIHFLTLQTTTPSDGTMVFTDFSGPHVPPPPHGSFRYDPINWSFDVRRGSLDGPVVFSGSKVLSSANTSWTHFPVPGAVLIPGVNYLLDGTPFSDFFPEPFSLSSDDGTRILMQTATVPEPVTSALLAVGVAWLAARRARRASSRPPKKTA
jgi:hypothetical protein